MPSYKTLIFATVLVCAVVGVVRNNRDLTPPRATVRHVTSESLRPAVKRVVVDAPRGRVPRRRRVEGRSWWFVGPREDEEWTDDEAPRPAVERDAAWNGDAPALETLTLPPNLAALIGRPAERATPVAISPSPDQPVLRPSERRRIRKMRRRLARQDRIGGATDRGTLPQPDPADPTPANPTPQPQANAGSTDVAFRTDEDARFPTDGQTAIPIQGAKKDGGTVSLWVQPGWERGNQDDATLAKLGDKLRLAKNADSLRLDAADADGPTGVDTPISEWKPGEWHHVAATWKKNDLSLYVDGELVGRKKGQTPIELPPDTDLVVGSDTDDDHGPVARGLIGRVDVRNRPLDDDEVARDYLDVVDADAKRGHGNDDRGKASDDHGNGSARGHSSESNHGNGR